mmetsp:Transcript_20231/g.56384  ORF Transcript_20231/g.56384 Transcript_20231/m.56384 type:complete len:246 (+) Transcript_20231:147-884(+)
MFWTQQATWAPTTARSMSRPASQPATDASSTPARAGTKVNGGTVRGTAKDGIARATAICTRERSWITSSMDWAATSTLTGHGCSRGVTFKASASRAPCSTRMAASTRDSGTTENATVGARINSATGPSTKANSSRTASMARDSWCGRTGGVMSENGAWASGMELDENSWRMGHCAVKGHGEMGRRSKERQHIVQRRDKHETTKQSMLRHAMPSCACTYASVCSCTRMDTLSHVNAEMQWSTTILY